MPGLLDYIFASLEVENLEQPKIKEYLCYLREITPQVPTIQERMKLINYRVKLTNRLIDLNRAAFEDLDIVLVKGRPALESKKKKYYLV